MPRGWTAVGGELVGPAAAAVEEDATLEVVLVELTAPFRVEEDEEDEEDKEDKEGDGEKEVEEREDEILLKLEEDEKEEEILLKLEVEVDKAVEEAVTPIVVKAEGFPLNRNVFSPEVQLQLLKA